MMKPWRIDQQNLRVRFVDDSNNSPPRGLRARGDNRNLVPHQPVDQCRLAHIGSPGQRNETCAMSCAQCQFYSVRTRGPPHLRADCQVLSSPRSGFIPIAINLAESGPCRRLLALLLAAALAHPELASCYPNARGEAFRMVRAMRGDQLVDRLRLEMTVRHL